MVIGCGYSRLRGTSSTTPSSLRRQAEALRLVWVMKAKAVWCVLRIPGRELSLTFYHTCSRCFVRLMVVIGAGMVVWESGSHWCGSLYNFTAARSTQSLMDQIRVRVLLCAFRCCAKP